MGEIRACPHSLPSLAIPEKVFMNRQLVSSLILSVFALAACHKKPASPAAEAPAPAAAPAPAPSPAAAPAPPAAAAQDSEKAEKQAKLDYAMMEDSFLNDPKGQWAASAKASSSFGEKPEAPPETPEKGGAWKLTDKPDGDIWNNNNQDIGFDWIELRYGKPVHATEIRAAFTGDESVESVTKVELLDADGKATTVWSGVSDQKEDRRGRRTWFVRKFEKTAQPVVAVKLTFANNVSPGYKEVDAVQLVGE
jgi:glucose/arabinose dehydrogenase